MNNKQLKKYFLKILKTNKIFNSKFKKDFICLIFRGQKAFEIYNKYEKQLENKFILFPPLNIISKKSSIELIYFQDNLTFEYNCDDQISETDFIIDDDIRENIREIIEIE